MSAIASARNSALTAILFAVAGCPNTGPSGNDNWNTAPNANTHDPYFPIASGDHAVDCNTCHGAFDTFRQYDCMNGCHAESDTTPNHSGVDGYAYDSPSCYSCHPRGKGAIDHSMYFPIATGEVHHGIACSTCHTNPTDRKQFSCVGGDCHPQSTTDGNHAGIDGYKYDSQSCYACHPKGIAESAVDHAKNFPIATGDKHSGIGCSTCHTTPKDRTIVTCATDACHPSTTSAQHGSVGGYQWDSPLCMRCHADSQVDRVATHGPFGISAGYSHYLNSCLSCHPGARSDKPWAADFMTLDCFAGCHNAAEMADHHAGFAGYQPTPASCLAAGCHPNGQKPW